MFYSDSDDDDYEGGITSVKGFTNLFNRLDKQKLQKPVDVPNGIQKISETPPVSSSNNESQKKTKNGSSSKQRDDDEDCSSERRPHSSKSNSKNNLIAAKPAVAKFSDDTEDLLAQADLLKLPDCAVTSLTIKCIKKRSCSKSPDMVEMEEPPRRKRVTRGSKNKKQKKPPTPEVFDLSTDEDIDGKSLDSFNVTLGSDIISLEEAEAPPEECSVRVRYKTEETKIKHPVGTKMSQVRMDVAQKYSLRADDLILINERDNEEVPDNMVMNEIPFASILEVICRVPNPKKLDPNLIHVKVQGSGGYRERLTVFLRRTTHIQQLIDDYVEKFKLQGKKFKLIFDGDNADLTETPESLDLEGGEMFDIVEIQ